MGVHRLGYPCIRCGGEQQTVKTCQLKNATDERLKELIERNLESLENVLEFNHENDITFFRIHSDTIPFASHPDVDFDWLNYGSDRLDRIGDYLDEKGIRVSMHPGQYTVLNSEDGDVVDNARRNLRYHTRFLDSLGRDETAKIILHVGGVYGDREAAMDRFAEVANGLDDRVRSHLVIENDESSYHVGHVLELSERTGLPVVFDQLHHSLFAPDTEEEPSEWMNACFERWGSTDGVPITHFSSEAEGSRGHHADRIDPDAFYGFIEDTESLEPFDVMLECKDKELALLELREALEEKSSGREPV